ncbi:MAG: hypothetical protein M1827_001683 [Pycnora praestabilis]|nr:MAG: hypothetical protein M1827_001683 [Pycnora praestabilis]
MVNATLITSIAVAAIAILFGAAYASGALDPVIDKVMEMFFKAEAKAEEKKMEAEGKQEGEDFVKSQLKGNKKLGDFKGNYDFLNKE